MRLRLTVNGTLVRAEIPADRTLLRFLRDDLGLTGTKEGCGAGECGACTVILNGSTVNSCLVLAAEADGAAVETIEGEAREGRLSTLQQALLKHQAVQCGFCTPGMVLSIRALLARHPHPSAEQVQEAIEGNFCRCTGYRQIVEAVLDATGQGGEVVEVRHA